MESGSTRESTPVFAWDQGDYQLKQPHDEYDVFVNGTHVGRKVLLTDSDSVDDIADHLRSQGFHGFTTQLTGDHYDVSVDDADAGENIRDHLKVYLDIR